MDDEARKKAMQASRSAFLRREAPRRERAAAAVLEQAHLELASGMASSAEFDLVGQRLAELDAARGLLSAAQHREELAGGVPLRTSRAGAPAVMEDDPTNISALVQPVTEKQSSSGFIALSADAISARLARKDFTQEKTVEEMQHDRVTALQGIRERLQEQRRSLPIYQMREELLHTIRQHQVVVIVGETGSGKTTQVLQYLFEEGFHRAMQSDDPATKDDSSAAEDRRLICTQPRRIAAISVAERVAHEVGCRCGSVVGYKVRFDDKSGPLTNLLFLTDGMMLKEFTADPELSRVAAIMVDEAHERSLNTDILLGLLRDVIRHNPHLRVIVASATINADKFCSFFGGAPLFTVKGRTFPVEVFYSEEPVADYITESAQTAMGIHLSKPLPGDILIFLPGQDAIEACAELLRQYMQEAKDVARPLLILPIYSSLPPKEQARIYETTPPNTRKVVIATNIAETSITIDGVVYVIDCGLCKQDFYNAKAMVEELRIVPTSQASATQRTGRAGRTQSGECFRLFTSYTFCNELPMETIPEVMRCSMSAVVLQLKALGINNLLHFDFIDPPSTESLERALDHLFLLGAMKSDGRLTVTGRRMAEFPMEPSLSKCLTRAGALGCARHMAMAAAMLTMDSVFINTRDPRERELLESSKEKLFAFGNGDVSGYIRVLDDWLHAGAQAADFCRSHCVNPRTMLRARDVFDQILKTYERIGIDVASEDAEAPSSRVVNVPAVSEALLSGYFFNVARLELDKTTYRIIRPLDSGHGTNGTEMDSMTDEPPTAELHPTSYLFRAGGRARGKTPEELNAIPPVLRERPPLVVFTQLRRTTKRFMIHVSAVTSPELVLRAAPVNYFTKEELETGPRKRQRS